MRSEHPLLALTLTLLGSLFVSGVAMAGGISGGTPPSWSEEISEAIEVQGPEVLLDHEEILKSIPADSVRRTLRGQRLIPLAEPSLRYLQNKVWEYGRSPIYLDDGTLFELESSLGGALVDRLRAARVIPQPKTQTLVLPSPR